MTATPSVRLLNNVKVATATTGSGTMTLGAAQAGAQTEATAGAVTNDQIAYRIDDGSAWEIGYGTYTSGGRTLTRVLDVSSTGSLLSLSGAAVVQTVARWQELQRTMAERTVPLSGGLTVLNTGGQTVTNGAQALLVRSSAASASNFVGFVQAAPATPYDATLKADSIGMSGAGGHCLAVRNSSSGKILLCQQFMTSSNPTWICQSWSAFSTFNGNFSVIPSGTVGYHWPWLRVNNDGTTITFYGSHNGWDWHPLQSQALASYIVSADQIGFGVTLLNSGTDVNYHTIEHFSAGLPL